MFLVALLLVSCTVRKGQAPPIVEAETPVPVAEPASTARARKTLLEAGLINAGAPIHRVGEGEIAQIKGSRFFVERVSLVDRDLVVVVRFIGEEKRDETGGLWGHFSRLLVDGRVWNDGAARFRDRGKDYIVAFVFYGIPSSEQDMFFLLRVKVPRGLVTQREPAADVAFIITKGDIKRH